MGFYGSDSNYGPADCYTKNIWISVQTLQRLVLYLWSSVMLLKDRVLYVGNVYIYAGLFAGGWRQRCKGYHRRSGSTSLAWAWPALRRQGSRARPPTILSTGTLVRSPSPTNSFKFALHIPQNKYRTMFSYIMVSQKKF